MVFVPAVPYIPPQQATLEAQELARDIEYAIAEYQENHPRVRQEDIQQALQIARSRAGTGAPTKTGIMVALVVTGLMLLAVLATVFFLAS